MLGVVTDVADDGQVPDREARGHPLEEAGGADTTGKDNDRLRIRHVLLAVQARRSASTGMVRMPAVFFS